MNCILFTVEILLIAVAIVQLSHCFYVNENYLNNTNIDTNNLVEIFEQPGPQYSKDKYMYKCLGVLIHEKVVLTPSSCTDVGYAYLTKVRFYDWTTYKSINTYTVFRERTVKDIINLSDDFNGQSHRGTINVVIFSKPIIQATPLSVEHLSEDNRANKFSRNTWQSKSCNVVTAEGKMGIKLSLKYRKIDTIYPVDCCKIDEDNTGLINSTNILDFNNFSDKVDEECVDKLSKITCFRKAEKYCEKSYNHGPVMCTNSTSEVPYLYGFVTETKGCVLEVSNLSSKLRWIRRYLEESNNG